MIVVVEPICRGDEHATLNAGLLATIKLAFPQSMILFLAESNQLSNVAKLLTTEGFDSIESMPIILTSGPTTYIKSVFSEFMIIRKILRLSVEKKADTIIFSAANATHLFCLKILLLTFFRSINVIAIIHSALQGIQMKAPPRPWNKLIWIKNVLQFVNFNRLKFIVPGEALLPVMLQELPCLKDHSYALNIAYFFHNSQELQGNCSKKVIELGFLGVGTLRKGIDTFFELAGKINEKNILNSPQIKFTVIGPVLEKSFSEFINSCVSFPVSNKLIPASMMAPFITKLCYAVFPYRKEEYQLVASAALLDAFEYLKPVIAFRNPYFEYCFEKMGDIGYLLDTPDEMEDLIISLVNNFPLSKYNKQIENIQRGRYIFEPNYLAPKLREIVNNIGL